MAVPTEDELLLLLGRLVFEMQEAEAEVHLAVTIVLGIPVAKSVENLRDLYAQKTMGQFRNLVRSRIGLAPSFDDFMSDYIERRNFAVHNFSRTSLFNIFTEGGREKLYNFLVDLRCRNRKLRLTFAALTEAWMRVLDPTYHSDAKAEEFRKSDLYKEIVTEFVPQLPKIFGRKAAGDCPEGENGSASAV